VSFHMFDHPKVYVFRREPGRASPVAPGRPGEPPRPSPHKQTGRSPR